MKKGIKNEIISRREFFRKNSKIRFILLFFATFFVVFANAQDIIIKENGDEIKAKVEEVGSIEIKYKKFGNETGPTYTILKSDIFMIKYADGSKDVFEQTTTKEKEVIKTSETNKPVEVKQSETPKTPEVVKQSETSTNVVEQTEKKEKTKREREDRKKNYFFLTFDFGGVKHRSITSENKNTKFENQKKCMFLDLRIGVTHNFSNYVGWDIFSLHYIPMFAKGFFDNIGTTPVQFMTGVRGYSPVFGKNMSVFTAFDLGTRFAFKDFSKSFGFACEWETGISLTKKFFVGLVLNHENSKSEMSGIKVKRNINTYSFRIGFHF